MKKPQEERKMLSPVKIIGKQPDSDVWVFNSDIHVNANGGLIPLEQRNYLLEGKQNDCIVDVPNELDSGEALKELFTAEKDLFGNNFPQVLMAHAASSLCANFDLVIDLFDGCGIPVLIGHPVSGKSTALKAVLSVFGNCHLVNNVTKKYIESRQANTTIPFGWDDVSDAKMLGEIAVSSFNQAGSATMRGQYKPHTVPIVTTNLDSGQLKVKSRWFRIQFEELNPKLKGQDRCKKEAKLKSAIKKASKSIAVVTCFIYKCIVGIADDELYGQMEGIIEDACTDPLLMEVDHRAQRQFALMLFCCKKILDVVGMSCAFASVKDKVIQVILPNYVKSGGPREHQTSAEKPCSSKVEEFLHDIPKYILSGDTDEILRFFDQDFLPHRCECGEVVTFNVGSLIAFLKTQGSDNAEGVTEHAIRHYIKKAEIGCVGRQVHFRNNQGQVAAAHIKRTWFNEEEIHALDERFGKRKRNTKPAKLKRTLGKSTKESSHAGEETLLDNQTGSGQDSSHRDDIDGAVTPAHNSRSSGGNSEISPVQEESSNIIDTESQTASGQGSSGTCDIDGAVTSSERSHAQVEVIHIVDTEGSHTGSGQDSSHSDDIDGAVTTAHNSRSSGGSSEKGCQKGQAINVEEGQTCESRTSKSDGPIMTEPSGSSGPDAVKTQRNRKQKKRGVDVLVDGLHPGEIKGKRARKAQEY